MLRISQLDELDNWMEKLMKYTKIAVVVLAALEIFIFLGLRIMCSREWGDSLQTYILNYLLIPTVRNLIIVTLGTIGVKMYMSKNKKIAAYIEMIAISIMCWNVIYTHSELTILIGIIGIPVILSIGVGDRKFLDNISLLNGGLLLLIQIQLVEVSKQPIEILVITLIYSISIISIFYLIARGLLAYYGDVLNCWNIVSETKKIDQMTGTLCKQAIYDELNEIIEDGRGSGMSIAIINVDDFERIISIYGEEKRGIILREIGGVIRRFIDNGIKIGRYSEEEFILLFENHGVMQVITVCELIRDFLCSQKIDEFLAGEITVSIGIATLSDKTKDAIELILKGKEALKRAKDGGKNKTVVS